MYHMYVSSVCILLYHCCVVCTMIVIVYDCICRITILLRLRSDDLADFTSCRIVSNLCMFDDYSPCTVYEESCLLFLHICSCFRKRKLLYITVQHSITSRQSIGRNPFTSPSYIKIISLSDVMKILIHSR